MPSFSEQSLVSSIYQMRLEFKISNSNSIKTNWKDWERLGNDEMGEIQKKLGKVASLSLNAGVANQQHLLQFLNNKNPFGLRIEVSKFSSTFFENLVKCCN